MLDELDEISEKNRELCSYVLIIIWPLKMYASFMEI